MVVPWLSITSFLSLSSQIKQAGKGTGGRRGRSRQVGERRGEGEGAGRKGSRKEREQVGGRGEEQADGWGV